MAESEELKCNICGVMVDSSRAKEHSSTPSHASLKAKLEENLKAVRKESYRHDSSVISQWSNSI